MLHIVNGDTVAEKLKQGVVRGDVLVWREVYPEGPLFLDPAKRRFRAEYLEKQMGIPAGEYLRISEEQEKHLARFRDYDEVTLWFEHDLFDQTMLCFLLHWFAGKELGRTKLNLLCVDSFPGMPDFRGLGELSVKQMETLRGTWQAVGDAGLELGARAWKAFCSADPRMLEELVKQDTSALPYLNDAVRFHLTRFPSTDKGIGAVEAYTLELLSAGVQNPWDLFRQAGGRFALYGMGDLQFWSLLRRLSQTAYPLFRIEGEPIPTLADSPEAFKNAVVRLTDTGREVLESKQDWITLGGMEGVWLGGVPFAGTEVWRWNGHLEQLTRK